MDADSSGSWADVKRVVISAEAIARRVAELGREIKAFYRPDEEIVVIGVLKGTFIFVADLVRSIGRPVQVDFLVASSYGDATVSSGEVRFLYDPATRIEGRHVLLVEDVVESGTTINRVVPHLLKREPRSIELCALLHKRLATDLVLEPRWVGFDAPEAFVVGYGLDWNEDYRHLPFIGSL